MPVVQKTLQKRSFYKKQKIVGLTADLHLRWQNEWQRVYMFASCRFSEKCGFGVSVLLLGLFSASLITVRYAEVLNLWWAWDYISHILSALENTVASYLFSPEGYRRFHSSNFTPWNILAYELNLYLFGLNPKGFYLHQLCALWCLSLSSFFFLRLWLNFLWSLCAVLLLICAAPIAVVSIQLMDVHYLEGLLACSLSLFCFVCAVRSNRLAWALPGALLYLSAMLCKEIYAPLPLVLLMFPEGNIRGRSKAGMLYGSMALLYLLMRKLYLGALLYESGSSANLKALFALPLKAPWLILGKSSVGLALFLLLMLYILLRRTELVYFFLASVLSLCLPLITIAFRIDSAERALVFFAWAMICASVLAIAHCFSQSKVHKLASLFALLLFSFFIIGSGNAYRNGVIRGNRDYQVVGEFVMNNKSPSILFLPDNEWAARKVIDLKHQLGLSDTIRIVSDAQFLRAEDVGATVYRYDEKSQQIEEVAGGVQVVQAQARDRRRDRELSIELWNTGNGLRWKFGPYPEKRYAVYIPSREIFMSRLPPEGFAPGEVEAMDFVVWYRSPQGWSTYSDMLQWSNLPQERLEWSKGDGPEH